MKKITSFIIINLFIVIVLVITNSFISGDFSKKVVPNELYIYNWGDYIDEKTLKKFENETGIKVVYQTYDSNEALLSKIDQGGTNIDIAVPSEYAIQKMIEKNQLLELNFDKIPNNINIDEKYKNKSFDQNNKYSIPYFWGTVGILYNKTKIGSNPPPMHWSDLWSESYDNNLLLFDGARETIGFSLQKNGFSLNDTNKEHLQIAYDDLLNLKSNVKGVVGDEIKDMMARGDAKAAITFSGEANDAMSNNPELEYIVPSEGSNLWFDNLVIPKSSQNTENAHIFINFMLENENAKNNAIEIGYSSPVTAVKNELESEKELKKIELNSSLMEKNYCEIDQTEECNEYDNSDDVINKLFEEFELAEELFCTQDISSESGEDIYTKLETYESLTQSDTLYLSEIFLRFKMNLNH